MNDKGLNNSNTIGSDFIKHDAVVSKVTKDSVSVFIGGNVDCTACNAKAACGVSESQDKKVEIFNVDALYIENERVTLIMKKSLGLKAVLYAYVFPFFILLTTLLIGVSFLSEWLAGLLSICILIPYYLVIYLSNNFLQREFSFSLLKQLNNETNKTIINTQRTD